jgi:chemotaxis protein methyltransferase CheR
VLDRMVQLMPDDGYLLLGAAESVIGVTTAFAPHETARGLNMKASTIKAARPLARAVGA